MTVHKPRQCFYIHPTQDTTVYGGYVPSLVVENKPGHTPLTGQGRFASPWVWGESLDDAQRICDQANAALGLTTEDATAIVLSSMDASGDDAP